HFTKDAYEKKLIEVLKIHTNDNVTDLLSKAFDVSRFKFLMSCDCYGGYLGFILFFGMKIEGYKCVKTASTPIETQKPLVKDEEAADVDVLGYSKDFTSLSCKENL
nr:putative ribonuclease H-like domain-containing protein [Tanacetum cinerariifolium]